MMNLFCISIMRSLLKTVCVMTSITLNISRGCRRISRRPPLNLFKVRLEAPDHANLIRSDQIKLNARYKVVQPRSQLRRWTLIFLPISPFHQTFRDLCHFGVDRLALVRLTADCYLTFRHGVSVTRPADLADVSRSGHSPTPTRLDSPIFAMR